MMYMLKPFSNSFVIKLTRNIVCLETGRNSRLISTQTKDSSISQRESQDEPGLLFKML